MKRSIWIGFEPREAAAFAVARSSIARHTDGVEIHPLDLEKLQAWGLYRRPTSRIGNRLIDEMSIRPDYNGYMSTEFAISRFLVPYLAQDGVAVFIDCDMLARGSLEPLFEECEENYFAVTCVQHDHRPKSDRKMDDQVQTAYGRKNWSSMMVFRCDHPSVRKLTPDYVNNAVALDLHQMKWCDDSEIGSVGCEWNYLVGHSECDDPVLVHFTEGGPWLEGFEEVEFSDEWRAELRRTMTR